MPKTNRDDYLAKLEKIAGLTRDEAKKELLSEVEKDLSVEVAKRIRAAEEEVKLKASQEAQEILIDAMEHGATSYVAEYTVSSVRVPDEEIKGRIIGREGRNIRAFEQATGCEIEIDETNDIRISSFDSIRREIARRALEKLIRDGRIQPEKIEEAVAQTKKQMEEILLEEGTKIAHEVELFNLPLDLLRLIGRYRFRTSYGQNLAFHQIEQTKIGMQLAHEVGADLDIVRTACLLCDVGKVISEEEGNHIDLGVNVAKKFRLPEKVVNAIAEHHEDIPFSSIESVVVWISDAISGSRPGARYEPFEDYAKHMGHIEEIVKSFPGVEQGYAFQAGREVRVLVKPEEVDDAKTTILAHDIAKKLENEVSYAGQIKVTVIRELRSEATTKAK
ncbi:ribonuclease Y [Candidatus Microgenomates bacterium]|nr:ribonuclease Y [Candidatus Microgenomates bacterium]